MYDGGGAGCDEELFEMGDTKLMVSFSTTGPMQSLSACIRIYKSRHGWEEGFQKGCKKNVGGYDFFVSAVACSPESFVSQNGEGQKMIDDPTYLTRYIPMIAGSFVVVESEPKSNR